MTDAALPPTQPERIAAAMVDALKAELGAGWLIDLFPADPEHYDGAGAERLALVQYRGSTYAEAQGLGSGTQTRLSAWVVHLTYQNAGRGADDPMRPLRDIGQVRAALQGRKIEGGHVRLVRDGLLEHTPGRRRYIVELDLAVPVLAAARPPLTPIFQPQEAAS